MVSNKFVFACRFFEYCVFTFQCLYSQSCENKTRFLSSTGKDFVSRFITLWDDFACFKNFKVVLKLDSILQKIE